MRTLWRGIVRTIFWSYERGSWPYDLAVILIIVFVLVTPTHWFHDQPQVSAAFGSKVQLQSEDPSSQTHTYRVDATTGRLLDRLDGLFDALGGWFAEIEARLDEMSGQLKELLDRHNVSGRAGSSRPCHAPGWDGRGGRAGPDCRFCHGGR